MTDADVCKILKYFFSPCFGSSRGTPSISPKLTALHISKHAARNDILLVCVFLGAEGVVQLELPGCWESQRKICFRSLYFNTVNAALSFRIWISFIGLERDPNEEDNTVEVPLTNDYAELARIICSSVLSSFLLTLLCTGETVGTGEESRKNVAGIFYLRNLINWVFITLFYR